MSADSVIPELIQPTPSSSNSTHGTTIKVYKSNFSVNHGKNSTINQYLNIQPSKIPPERIEYNVEDPNLSFTGRENILKTLHTTIKQNRNKENLTILSQENVASGFGAMGKTETMKKYVQQHKKTFGHVLWIDAETHPKARNCIFNIARLTNTISLEPIEGKSKKNEDIAAEVYNFICQKSSLIVFDNANSLLNVDGIKDLLPGTLLPGSIKPAIVVTSRNRKWNNCSVIILPRFKVDESYNLLIQQLKFEDTQENRDLAKETTHLCNGIPLVIQKVISVIKMESEESEALGEDGYSMQDFIKDYHKGKKSYITEKPNDVPPEHGPNPVLDFSKTFRKREMLHPALLT